MLDGYNSSAQTDPTRSKSYSAAASDGNITRLLSTHTKEANVTSEVADVLYLPEQNRLASLGGVKDSRQ